ncbi:Non-reducing end alpha-L-arabinofuranosidase BoGH43A [Colletotrichum siamense]|uniref:Non-reducing end alpha-L-arabinofuranosidase BoGH43A n=1 Tax=Colletotrichum siamense TaxID=690259 RepID=A0A9P5F515_COLSI|nr:Non-reducing end alpha-L-arabinofuranosidase BoGH43A [Colletotrichum siamense]KAF4867113.1 Non-reducing end alpha-L-arabinofuranosidase BoGH43A [Colletotrichum siamense]
MKTHTTLLSSLLAFLASGGNAVIPKRQSFNSTFNNPVFPGWHADPSCVFVPERINTTFCVTSSFLNFPGLPIYASKDLLHWEHASNAFNRAEQIPGHASMNGNPRGGIWAPSIRYRDGKFYLVVTYATYEPREKVHNLLFHTEDPYSDAPWSIPLLITNPGGSNHIDPDLFWEDGIAYMATGWGRIFLSVIDVNTGNASDKVEIWKGTGGNNPEAPHIYKKDGFFYLLIAEGGAGLGHSATMARSQDLYGPYESYSGNPVLTNRGSGELFQSVGHADLFRDVNNNWWAVALATRSGPELENYPMGRETVLTAVTWANDSWPVFNPVRGNMHGPLPRTTAASHKRLLIDTGDEVNFNPGTSLPHHFVHFRSKVEEKYTIINNSLRLLPSRSNLTGSTDHFDPEDGVTFVGRKQTATKFSFSVDLSFVPKNFGDEAGISIFHSQQQHIDLSVVLLEDSNNPQLRMTATTYGRPSAPVPETVLQPVPRAWVTCPIRLSVEALDTNDYKFVASSTCNRVNASIDMGIVSSDVTSGGFLGAYS